jgi:hypothetical protein
MYRLAREVKWRSILAVVSSSPVSNNCPIAFDVSDEFKQTEWYIARL